MRFLFPCRRLCHKTLARDPRRSVASLLVALALASQKSLRASATRMGPADPAAADAPKKADGTHRAEAKVEAIGKDEVTLSHGPIASIQWPAMTMGFKAAPEVLLKSPGAGETVAFEFRERDGAYEVTKMERKK